MLWPLSLCSLSHPAVAICPSDEQAAAVHGHQAIIFGYHANGDRHGTSLRCQICLGFITTAERGTNKLWTVSVALLIDLNNEAAQDETGRHLRSRCLLLFISWLWFDLSVVACCHLCIIYYLSSVVTYIKPKGRIPYLYFPVIAPFDAVSWRNVLFIFFWR